MNLSTVLWIPDARRIIFSYLSFPDLDALRKAYALFRIRCLIRIPDRDQKILMFDEITDITIYLYSLTKLTAYQNILLTLIAKGNENPDAFVLEAIRKAIQIGVNINNSDNYDLTPLMIACSHPSPKIIQILLEAGAHTHLRNNLFETALEMCFNYGSSSQPKETKEIVQLFLANPGFIQAFGNDDSYFREIMKKACIRGYSQTVQLLIDYRVPVNFRSDTGLTSLMYAVPNPHTIKILLEAGADPTILDNYNHLAIDYVSWPPGGGWKDIGSYLLLKSAGTRYYPLVKWLVR